MSIYIFRLLLPVSLLFPVVYAARAEEFRVPPAAVASEDLRGARDRLVTGLFFRGELADGIMGAGLQSSLVDTARFQTRSEVRLALMDWIYDNPDKAANLYFYLKNRRPGETSPAVPVSYALPTWELRSNFIALAGAVNKAAADASIGDEEMSLVAQRLFGSAQALPEDYAPLVPGAAGAPGAQGLGGGVQAAYADYLLSPERVEKERQTLEKRFEIVKARLEGGGGIIDKGADPDRIRRLLGETFLIYRDFTVFLSNLKGLKKISGSEAGRLEEVRRAFRRNLCQLEAMAVMQRLDGRAAGLPEGAPGAAALRAESLNLRKAFEAFLADAGANPENVNGAARRLYELKNAADFWEFRMLVHGRLLRLKTGISVAGFSCVWDKFVFIYLSRFFPSAEYVRAAAALSARGQAIDAALEGVAAGDSAAASAFAGKELSLTEAMAAAEDGTVRLRNYSGLNRRLQFVFWDALLNPLGLRPGPKGISAGVKL